MNGALSPWPALPFLAVLAAVMILLSAAWAGAARRRRLGLRGSDGETVPSAVVLAEGVEVRLAIWMLAAATLWLAARAADPPSWSHGRTWGIVLGGMVSAGPAIAIGRQLGCRRDPPAGLRWLLAPLHGLAGWLLWLRGVARERGAARPPSAPAPADELFSPETPRDGVLDLSELSLEEVMVPRSQVAALEASRTPREVLPDVRRRPHSLYPVYERTVDQPLGVVRILDLANPDFADRPLRDLARPVAILPETVRGLRLIGDLCGQAIPAALVVDEFGGIAGLITIEDLMEVLVGDLEGEHEVVRNRILAMEAGAWRVDGSCTIEEFNRRFGPLLPEGEYETVAGFVLDRVGEIPAAGERIDAGRVHLEVLQATERRILWLRAETATEEAGAAAGREA